MIDEREYFWVLYSTKNKQTNKRWPQESYNALTKGGNYQEYHSPLSSENENQKESANLTLLKDLCLSLRIFSQTDGMQVEARWASLYGACWIRPNLNTD